MITNKFEGEEDYKTKLLLLDIELVFDDYKSDYWKFNWSYNDLRAGEGSGIWYASAAAAFRAALSYRKRNK